MSYKDVFDKIEAETGIKFEIYDSMEALEAAADDNRIENTIRENLKETIAQTEKIDKTKWWVHMRNFLSNAANLAALGALGIKIAEILGAIPTIS